MISHLKAIQAHLASLSYLTHLIAAPEISGQYLVLGGRTWATPGDVPLCGRSQSLETDWRVTAVAGTPEGVGIMLDRVRGLLSPAVDWTQVPMSGRSVWVRFERSEFLAVDRDSTIVGTNRHPAYGVDTYQLMSEPI